MIINPRKIWEEGHVRAISGYDFYPDKQIQQNGIDLRIAEICELTGNFVISEKQKQFPERKNLLLNPSQGWELEGGKIYSAETCEEVEVPEDMCAMIIQRSSLNRGGILISTGIYDSGFCGKIGMTMRVALNTLLIKETRIAQIIFLKADAASLYDGQYQNQASSYDSK